MNITRNEDAISPVIGVMLMLVVCIIVAALVSGFAGSIGNTGSSKAPQASIDIAIISTGGMQHDQYVTTFEHNGGDSIPSKDMKIISRYTTTDGTTYSQTLTPDSPKIDIYGDGVKVGVPYLADVSQVGYAGSAEANFGSYTFKSGDILSTGTSRGTGWLKSGKQYGVLGFDETDSQYGFGPGSVVDITIIHIPSQKQIAHEEVIVR